MDQYVDYMKSLRPQDELMETCQFVLDSYSEFLLGKDPLIDKTGEIIHPQNGGIYEMITKLEDVTFPGANGETNTLSFAYPVLQYKKKITPRFCRLNRRTYSIQIQVQCLLNGIHTYEPLPICEIPLMVGLLHEVEPYDTSGYFIVDGLEVLLVNIERHLPHIPLYRMNEKNEHDVYVCNSKGKFIMTMKQDKSIQVDIGSHSVSIFTLSEMLYIIGFRGDSETIIRSMNCTDEERKELSEMLKDFNTINPENLATKINNNEMQVLECEANKEIELFSWRAVLSFLPNTGTEKLLFFLDCLQGLFQFYRGDIPPTNLDSMENKNLLTAGALSHLLVEYMIRNQRRKWEKGLQKISATHQQDSTQPGFYFVITKTFMALSNAIQRHYVNDVKFWTKTIPPPVRFLDRNHSTLQVSSMLRQIVLKPKQMSFKVSDMRLPHGSSYGFICPATTSENENIGFIKSLAFTAEISSKLDPDLVMQELENHKMIRIHSNTPPFIYLNNRRKGGAKMKSYEFLRYFKRTSMPKMACYKDKLNNIHLDCLGGRPIRPLLVNGNEFHPGNDIHPEMDFNQLVYEGIIEWVDINEQKYCIIAHAGDEVLPIHTHQELHNASIFSIKMGRIPGANHDMAPRNLIATGMVDQAIGCRPFLETFETKNQFALNYPQKVLTPTDVGRWTGTDHVPTSINVVCAIYTLDNMDDAIVMNSKFIDHGAFQLTASRSIRYTLPKGTKFGKPKKKPFYISEENYKLIDEKTGILKLKTRIFPETVIAFQVNIHDSENVKPCTVKTLLNIQYSEETDYRYYLDKIHISTDQFNNQFGFFKISHIRKPMVGDKFASHSAQKGVCGKIMRPEDLMFTMKDGITPDIVINPHGFPSRKTFGHLISMLAGKVRAVDTAKIPSKATDCTPFSKTLNIEEMKSILLEHGFQSDGKELCIHGTTGEIIPEPIFIGILPYQLLDHFVADKINKTVSAPRHPETKMLLKGRKDKGGMRYGRMERDVAIAHGVSAFLQEKTVPLSDGFPVHFCEPCQEYYEANLTSCPYCKMENKKNKLAKLTPNALLRFKTILKAGYMKCEEL